jgi:hypothetical protein
MIGQGRGGKELGFCVRGEGLLCTWTLWLRSQLVGFTLGGRELPPTPAPRSAAARDADVHPLLPRLPVVTSALCSPRPPQDVSKWQKPASHGRCSCSHRCPNSFNQSTIQCKSSRSCCSCWIKVVRLAQYILAIILKQLRLNHTPLRSIIFHGELARQILFKHVKEFTNLKRSDVYRALNACIECLAQPDSLIVGLRFNC